MSKRKSIDEKVKESSPELYDAAQSMSASDIKSVIYAKAILFSESKDAEAEDEELAQAKAVVKALREPYVSDQKAAQEAIKWLSGLLKDRGAP